METLIKREHERTQWPVWLPPLVSALVLFVLFVTATMVRRSNFADTGRPVMIVVSSTAAGAIVLSGGWLVLQGRRRGWGAALAGLSMLAMGGYTLVHVLRSVV